MVRLLLSIVFSCIILICIGQRLDLAKTVEGAKSFYASKLAGQVVINTTFKSSIAESYQSDQIEISFCKDQSAFNIRSGEFSAFLKRNKYYYIDLAKGLYIDYSSKRGFKKDKWEALKQYPQFNSDYFDRFQKKSFKIESVDNLFHIYDGTDHYYFDTLTLSIVKHRSIVFSVTGIQIKEWRIVGEKYTEDCSELVWNPNILAGLKRVNQFKGPVTRSIKGRTIAGIITDTTLTLDDGNVVSANSLKGKFLLLDFFYQSCMPCIQSFNHLKLLYPFVDSAKLTIIGVDPIISDSSTMKKFKSRYRLKHPVLLGTQGAKLNELFNPKGVFPFYALANEKGQIIDVFEGYSEEHLHKIIALLQ